MSTLRTDRLAELDQALAQRRAEYERVRALTQQPAYQRDLQSVLATVVTILDVFHAGDTGEKAIYLLGRLRGAVALLEADLAIVAEYETLRVRRRKLEASGPV